MFFLKKLFSFLKKDKKTEAAPAQETPKSFFLYIVRVPEILTYFRREKSIPKRKLELVLVDNEEQSAWKIAQIVQLLLPDLNMLYLVTGRSEAYQDLLDEAYAEHGLLIVLLDALPEKNRPGNLVLDLNDWEKHLDITG